MPDGSTVHHSESSFVDGLLAGYVNALQLRLLVYEFGANSPEVLLYQANHPNWQEDEQVFQEVSRKALLWRHKNF